MTSYIEFNLEKNVDQENLYEFVLRNILEASIQRKSYFLAPKKDNTFQFASIHSDSSLAMEILRRFGSL